MDGYRANDVRMWDSDENKFIELERDEYVILVPSRYKEYAHFESIMRAWFESANTTRTSIRFDDDLVQTE